VVLDLGAAAPNLSGVHVIDRPRPMYLAEPALSLAGDVLKGAGMP
jgi:23S rRNA U2552 (ribose-2'-O)-methylase RlmE/FtsJ